MSIYEEGQQAFHDGLLADDNPYRIGSSCYIQWMNGHTMAKAQQAGEVDDGGFADFIERIGL